MEERALIYSVYSEHKFYGTIGLMVTHAFNIDFRTENLQEAFRNDTHLELKTCKKHFVITHCQPKYTGVRFYAKKSIFDLPITPFKLKL